jgi:fluoride exporter
MAYAWVAFGGALGSVLRFWLAGLVGEKAGAPWWGTLAVNAIGSFVIGLAAVWKEQDLVRNFLMIGVLGGFTTFSAFSLQTLELMRSGQVGTAVWNVGLSIGVCLVAVWLGWILGNGR